MRTFWAGGKDDTGNGEHSRGRRRGRGERNGGKEAQRGGPVLFWFCTWRAKGDKCDLPRIELLYIPD